MRGSVAGSSGDTPVGGNPGEGLCPTWTLQTGERETLDKAERAGLSAVHSQRQVAKGQMSERKGSKATQTSPGGEQPPPRPA